MINKKAFTMAETLIAMVMLGILGACALSAMHPLDIKESALIKSGANTLLQINFATTQILAKNSVNYQMTKLITPGGVQFSINDDGADAKLIQLYKKTLMVSRNSNVPASYTTSELQSGHGSKIVTETVDEVDINLKVSDFTQGTVVKNGAYMALKLHSNCTTDETYIFDPSVPEKRGTTKSCGLIFFDVNAQEPPNILGIDQYIVAIGKSGIR